MPESIETSSYSGPDRRVFACLTVMFRQTGVTDPELKAEEVIRETVAQAGRLPSAPIADCCRKHLEILWRIVNEKVTPNASDPDGLMTRLQALKERAVNNHASGKCNNPEGDTLTKGCTLTNKSFFRR